jgi:hypothetical protein
MIGKALQLKYAKEGWKCDTRDGVITRWEHPDGIPQPDDAAIATAIQEYQASLITEKDSRKNRKKDLLKKLNITIEDIKALKELLQDGHDA